MKYLINDMIKNGSGVEEIKGMLLDSCAEYPGLVTVFDCAYVKDDFSTGESLGDGFALVCPTKTYFVHQYGICDKNGKYVRFQEMNVKANNKRAKKPDYQDLFSLFAKKMATKIGEIYGKEAVDEYLKGVIDYQIKGETERREEKIADINAHHEYQKRSGFANEEMTEYLTDKAVDLYNDESNKIVDRYTTIAKAINPKSTLAKEYELSI